MNFDFLEEEKQLFEEIRRIAAIAPSEASLAEDPPEKVSTALKACLAKLAAAGYLRLGFEESKPEQAITLMAAMETLACHSRALFLNVAMSTRLLGRALAVWATDSQKEQWLEGFLKGEELGALAMCEETMNVENDPLTTTGTRKNGRILLNGHKNFVINAPLADRIGVVGTLDGRPVIFILDPSANGLSMSDRIATMGYEGAHMASLECCDCVVPEDNVVLPPENAPVLDMLRLWENEVLIAAALGLLQSSFVEARDFAKDHRTGGKPAIAYQEVGFKLSEMLTLYQTAQLLAYRAVWTRETQPKEGISLIWCAKVFATEAAERVAGEALRILAGQGYRSGSDSESAYRAAKWTQIGGLSTEIARVRIGDLALGYRGVL